MSCDCLTNERKRAICAGTSGLPAWREYQYVVNWVSQGVLPQSALIRFSEADRHKPEVEPVKPVKPPDHPVPIKVSPTVRTKGCGGCGGSKGPQRVNRRK